MTISEQLIKKLKEAKVTYNTVCTETYMEDLHDESHFGEDEEINLELNGEDFSITFDVEYSWRCVNSGGNGWDEPNYDYSENEESEITIKYIYDEEGEEYDADYKNDSVLLEEVEKMIESLI